MSNYNVNPAAVRGVVDEFTTATAQLNTSLSNLQSSVTRFTAANHGQAPDAYGQAQALWSQGQAEMTDALRQGHVTLTNIVDNYVYGDNKGAAIFA